MKTRWSLLVVFVISCLFAGRRDVSAQTLEVSQGISRPSLADSNYLGADSHGQVWQDDVSSGDQARVVESGTGKTEAKPTMVIVVGAAGLPEYEKDFSVSANAMMQVAEKAGFDWVCIGLQDVPMFAPDSVLAQGLATVAEQDFSSIAVEQLKTIVAWLDAEASSPVWFVMFGHGTYNGQNARFNLRGPDITAKELAELLGPIRRPTVIVNCSSSSAPFLNRLSRPGRIVITSTRDGAEQNYSRFGLFFAQAFLSPDADLDKDDQVSLLEAFLSAANRVTEFYEAEKRLATEHALIDDNGDQRGTPEDWFVGVRVESQSKSGGEPDGRRAHQIHLLPSGREEQMSDLQKELRVELELKIDALRRQRGELSEAAYFEQLDTIVGKLVDVYDVELPQPAIAKEEQETLVLTPEQGVIPPRPTKEHNDAVSESRLQESDNED